MDRAQAAPAPQQAHGQGGVPQRPRSVRKKKKKEKEEEEKHDSCPLSFLMIESCSCLLL